MQISVTEQGSIMRDQRKTIYDPDYGIFLVYAPVNFPASSNVPAFRMHPKSLRHKGRIAKTGTSGYNSTNLLQKRSV